MSRLIALVLFVLVAALWATAASAPTGSSSSHITFVSVRTHHPVPLCCYELDTDQPLFADVYEYDVSLQSDCTVYTGRYENFFDYFPGFKAGQAVKADIGKRVIVLSSPSGESMRMSIVDREKAAGCSSANR